MASGLKTILRSRHWAGLWIGGVLLVQVLAVGTLGYHYIGRPTAGWIDSFYMTFITISSIGFTEVVDLSTHPYGRLFTVFIAVVGIGALSYLFSTLVALLVDSELNQALKGKRMEKEISRLSGHYIVCGIGRVGTNVAQELRTTQRPFVVIEVDRAALDQWLEHNPSGLHLHDDAADDDALRRAGVERAAGVFAVTSDDSHNLMVALSVKLINPKVRVVVRLHDVRNTQKARKAGADEIVSPDFSGGMRIASAMVRPHVVNFMDKMLKSEGNLRVEEVVVPAGFAGAPVGQLLPRSRDYLLLAVHEHGDWRFNPADDHVVKAGDAIVVLASPEGRLAVERKLRA
jgi:voltage-gated potassium channel